MAATQHTTGAQRAERPHSTLDADAGQLVPYHQAGSTHHTLDVITLQTENERLQRKVHELTTALEQVGIALREKDEALARQNAALRFEYDARCNAALGSGVRLTLNALRRDVATTPADAEGWHALYIGGLPDEHGKPKADGLVGKAGQSRGAVSDHLKVIAATGAIDLKTVPTRNAKGERMNRTFVRPTPLFDTPAELKLPEPRNHGGARPRCKT